MVQLKDTAYLASDGQINMDIWLNQFVGQKSASELELLRHACFLSKLAGEHVLAPSGQSCFQQGLVMAEILNELQVDAEGLVTSIIYNSVHFADLQLDIVKEQLGLKIAKLVESAERMDSISSLQNQNANRIFMENSRKMLLSMVEDIRVVLIKLAEQTSIMRVLSNRTEADQKRIANETMNIYAPLANRLGITTIKWELEDRSFRFLEPETYKTIAKLLQSRRIDREKYVGNFMNTLKHELETHDIHGFQISGRAKHIYSIYRKMCRKNVDYHNIYDITAVRVLVDNIENCYQTLSLVHEKWEQIQEEFDDYIANPKPNGYQSLHTAIVGPEGKNVEVQIRTYAMHEACEVGVAAHWLYKEGKPVKSGFEEKITWLRQLLDWQKELTGTQESSPSKDSLKPTVKLDDRIYVFTPKGDVFDLPAGSTPLDFAYHVHSEIGHRCRGAKINGVMVTLDHELVTGDRVDIITTKVPQPSRDWLNPHLNFVKTSRAKAKIHHWFKEKDYEKDKIDGESLFEQEAKRASLPQVDLDKISKKLSFKNRSDLFAALGRGELKFASILHLVKQEETPPSQTSEKTLPFTSLVTKSSKPKEITVAGVDNLLTHIAKCCHPIPGDPIIGFITRGRGVAIHRQDCENITGPGNYKQERIIPVCWEHQKNERYASKIHVLANHDVHVLKDLTLLLSNEKITLLAMETKADPYRSLLECDLIVEIDNVDELGKVMNRIRHIKNVLQVSRQV